MLGMDREDSKIYSLKVSAKSISAFSSYEMRTTAKIIKSKTLQKSQKYPKLQFQIRWNLEYR